MKIYPEQLTAQLAKCLAPVYLITGDEILLVNESRDQIIAQCKKQGLTERQLFFADRGFNWQQLTDASANLSLFSHKQIIELRIQTDTINKPGKDALMHYCQQLPADTLLIINCPKLDNSQQNTSWYKLINQIGLIITVWPLPSSMLARFVQQRLQRHQLATDAAGVRLLISANEGNLLALVQSIEKLALFYSRATISCEQIAETLNDNARYSVFSLTDAIQHGNARQALRILMRLEQEDIEPTLILWALTHELRKLSELGQAKRKQQTIESIMRKYRVLPKQQTALIKASERQSVHNWLRLLVNCAEIDQHIKGAMAGNYWQEFKRVIMQACVSEDRRRQTEGLC